MTVFRYSFPILSRNIMCSSLDICIFCLGCLMLISFRCDIFLDFIYIAIKIMVMAEVSYIWLQRSHQLAFRGAIYYYYGVVIFLGKWLCISSIKIFSMCLKYFKITVITNSELRMLLVTERVFAFISKK